MTLRVGRDGSRKRAPSVTQSTMPRKETATAPITAESQQSAVSEGIDAFELPKSIVIKLAKSGIPEQSKVQKETILALLKGSTVFINLLGKSVSLTQVFIIDG